MATLRALSGGANVGESCTESAGELKLFLFGVLALGVDERAVGVVGTEGTGVENRSANDNDADWDSGC